MAQQAPAPLRLPSAWRSRARVVRRRVVGATGAVVLIIGLGPAVARAYDFEISARTEAYAYQSRRYGPDGLSLLNRRRLTQYLGLRVFNLLEGGQQAASTRDSSRPPALLYVTGLMRFHTDFGDFSRRNIDNPELDNDRFELLLGTLEGRNLWGRVDFSAGRQYDAELADFFAYDGVRVRINAPWKLFVEAYAGAQVNRSLPASAVVFETDGTSSKVGSANSLAPSFGAVVGLADPDQLDFRLAYRGVASRTRPEPDPASRPIAPLWGINQELLFAHLALPVLSWGSRAAGAVRYNLLTSSFDELQLEVDQRAGQRHHLALAVLRSRPHFDGDSIFNVFAVEPYTELSGRYALDLTRQSLLELRAGYQWFWHGDALDTAPNGSYSLSGVARWWSDRLQAELDLFALAGAGGHRAGGELNGCWRSRRFAFGRYITVDGRVSLVTFADPNPLVRSLTTLGLQSGARVNLLSRVALYLSLQDNISRLYRSDLRALLSVDMAFAP